MAEVCALLRAILVVTMFSFCCFSLSLLTTLLLKWEFKRAPHGFGKEIWIITERSSLTDYFYASTIYINKLTLKDNTNSYCCNCPQLKDVDITVTKEQRN